MGYTTAYGITSGGNPYGKMENTDVKCYTVIYVKYPKQIHIVLAFVGFFS